MSQPTHAAASAAILAHCNAGTIVQREWHGRDAAGREVACLLGAIDPSVNSTADCNAELMPMWLAELTLVLFDGLPPKAIYPIARRYGELVGRWHVLSSKDWERVLAGFLCRVIDEASQTYWPAVAAIVAAQAAVVTAPKARAAAQAAAQAAVRAAPWPTDRERLFTALLDQIESQEGEGG